MLRFAPPFRVPRVIVTSPCHPVTVTLLLSCVMRDRRTRLVGFVLVPVPVRSMRRFPSLSPSGHFHSHVTLVMRIRNLSGSTALPHPLLTFPHPIFPFPSSPCLPLFTLPIPYINPFPFAYLSPARPLVPPSVLALVLFFFLSFHFAQPLSIYTSPLPISSSSCTSGSPCP